MSVFTLEALDANSGDALLVHYGTATNPRLMVVDGGFTATYRTRLKPRLAELHQAAGGAAPLRIDHLVVSHLDGDHIEGVVRLFEDLDDALETDEAPPFTVQRLWHNSFEDALGAVAGPAGLPVPPAEIVDGAGASDAVAASIPQARVVRDVALKLGIDGNPPFGGLVVGPQVVDLGAGLEATVVGPDAARLRELQVQWERDVRRRVERGELGDAVVAAFTDTSVPNLSSIVLLLRCDARTMLLTGDGRGDHTLAGLEAAGVLDAGGTLHVDVLKVPHHGSDRNVDRSYFERITADHYVISGNGVHDNPSAHTLQMITATQGDRPYTIHLTYDHNVGVLTDDLAANPGRRYVVDVRTEDRPSLRIDLGDPPR
ncbi:MAG TPA: hypothetical protein VIL36_22230 [Acidimicrobiales bacterium]